MYMFGDLAEIIRHRQETAPHKHFFSLGSEEVQKEFENHKLKCEEYTPLQCYMKNLRTYLKKCLINQKKLMAK